MYTSIHLSIHLSIYLSCNSPKVPSHGHLQEGGPSLQNRPERRGGRDGQHHQRQPPAFRGRAPDHEQRHAPRHGRQGCGAQQGVEKVGKMVCKNGGWWNMVWVNYNELTTSSLEIIVSKGNHPQMALIQVSELL